MFRPSLKLFVAYVRSQNGKLHEIDDKLLSAFRDEQYAATLVAKRSKQNKRAAQATTNAKLRRVYHWLHWLVEEGLLPHHVIGMRGQVRSTFNRRAEISRRLSVWDRQVEISCPLVFRVPGQKSKHKKPKDVPTETTVDALHAYFFSATENEFCAHRNCLLVDLASEVGLRRGSINSLRVEQFSEDALQDEEDALWLQPDVQKFDYENTFPVPLYLAQRVASFCREFRQPLIEAKQVDRSVHLDRVFVSARDGAPLTDLAVTQIVSRAMRASGMGRGVGIHALRAKFASTEIDRESAERARMGLDTSAASVAQAVSMKLGQSNPKSLFPYAVAGQSKEAAAVRRDSDTELAQLRSEVRDLRAALSRLGRSSVQPD